MPLFKSADAHSTNDEVIIFEPEAPQHNVIEVEEPQGFQFNFPSVPEADTIEVSDMGHEEPAASHKEKGPKDIWDWQSHGIEKLLNWVQERLNTMPTHTGETSGIERLMHYLKRLNSEISKAISTDFEGKIDVKTLEGARKWIYNTIHTLKKANDDMVAKHYEKAASDTDGKMVKEARTPYNGGIIVTVPLLISRCARVCINGTVSAGHDPEKLYSEQVKKYALNVREQAELAQHLEDMGFPLRTDRLMNVDEEVEIENGRGDLASNYFA
jgi:hypothetical protein